MRSTYLRASFTVLPGAEGAQEENRRFAGQRGAVPKPWFSAQPACQKSASCILSRV
jgi:hypothetical protein